MYLHSMQQFYKSRIVMVDNLAMSHIKYGNPPHLFCCQAKVPYINVLFHTALMHGFRNDYHTPLGIPAQYDRFLLSSSPLCLNVSTSQHSSWKFS